MSQVKGNTVSQNVVAQLLLKWTPICLCVFRLFGTLSIVQNVRILS